MKKLIFAIFSILIAGCDSSNNPISPNNNRVVVNDTNIQKINSLNVVGRIIQKNGANSSESGFNAVVCLENAKHCAKTNSSGQYQISSEEVKGLGRSLQVVDTVITPENVITKIRHDTVITYDTIVKNDTTYIYHNLKIINDEPYKDSAIVYSNSRILYEIPVTSWNSVLPDKYIVQRNISGSILNNEWFKYISKAEAVYFGTDSIAYVIPLECFENTYSGFIYEPYNDSSFKSGAKVNNIFVRVLDSKDTVWGISNVVSYSERSGDLNNVFSQIVPGAIQKYPKPSMFAVIENGDSIKIISRNINNKVIHSWIDVDSVYFRMMIDSSTYLNIIDDVHLFFFKTDSLNLELSNILDTGSVDSFEVSFYSPVQGDYTFYSNRIDKSFDNHGAILSADSGMNYFRFSYNNLRSQDPVNKSVIYFVIYNFNDTSDAIDAKIRLHFK